VRVMQLGWGVRQCWVIGPDLIEQTWFVLSNFRYPNKWYLNKWYPNKWYPNNSG